MQLALKRYPLHIVAFFDLQLISPCAMAITHITVRGARQHNLRDINVQIPRNTLTVVTGLSGSGKSSLAFDTIYAEGQRRYVETLSAYARQFLDQIERPDVDSIEGLSPAISIEQKTTSRSPRSTVGTITEIYDYLRLLYASVGVPHCPHCGRQISRQSAEQIVERILALAPGERVTIYAPVVRGRKGEFKDLLDKLDQQGFRARVDGEIVDLAEPPAVSTNARTTPSKPSSTAPSSNPASKKLSPPPSKKLCRWPTASSSSAQQQDEQLYSSSMACPDCGLDVPEARAPQLLLQLHLRRLPRVPRPRQHLRLRSRQDHHRLVQAPARRRASAPAPPRST